MVILIQAGLFIRCIVSAVLITVVFMMTVNRQAEQVVPPSNGTNPEVGTVESHN